MSIFQETNIDDKSSEYFRPLTKREIVNVDNAGQVSQGEPETEGSEYFRPLPKTKRNMMKYAKLPLSEKRSEDCVINPSAAVNKQFFKSEYHTFCHFTLLLD